MVVGIGFGQGDLEAVGGSGGWDAGESKLGGGISMQRENSIFSE